MQAASKHWRLDRILKPVWSGDVRDRNVSRFFFTAAGYVFGAGL